MTRRGIAGVQLRICQAALDRPTEVNLNVVPAKAFPQFIAGAQSPAYRADELTGLEGPAYGAQLDVHRQGHETDQDQRVRIWMRYAKPTRSESEYGPPSSFASRI